jgi:hypothetical protein
LRQDERIAAGDRAGTNFNIGIIAGKLSEAAAGAAEAPCVEDGSARPIKEHRSIA